MKTYDEMTPTELVLSGASTKQFLEVMAEWNSDLQGQEWGPETIWAYLHAKQNEAIIERLDTLLELEQQKVCNINSTNTIDFRETDVTLLAQTVNLSLNEYAVKRGMQSA